jgi:ribosomal protein S18 acetylase RimI-like enzyme
MPTDEKRFAPAADRNREPLEQVLRRVLPTSGTVLELASGTGQHAVHFARAFPHLIWQPSDIDPECLHSIHAWRQESNLSNLREPLSVDAMLAWPLAAVDAVVCINLAHIAPWSATESLLARARDVLPEGGLLFFYGPFFESKVQTAASNLEFDASLRSRNASWGLRRLDVLRASAESAGFFFQDRFAMPSNNLSLVFRKAPARIDIREIQSSDLARVGDLLEACFVDTYAEKMPEVKMTDRRRQELRDFSAKHAKGTSWVAQVGGQIVGTVYAIRPGEADALSWRPDFAQIKHLAVAPAFRRSGISEALMEHAYASIRAWGGKGACLHVRRGAHGVARFYQKQGFVREPAGDFDRLPEVFLHAYFKTLM